MGGGITNRPSFLEELMPFIKKHLRKWAFDQTIIKIAQFKSDAGMIGAFQHFKKSTINKKRPSEWYAQEVFFNLF